MPLLNMNKIFLSLVFVTTATDSSVLAATMSDNLNKPHKTHTRHMQLCIPGADIVECDSLDDGTKPHIMTMDDGVDMVWWDEYHVSNGQEKATAMWSAREPDTVVMKPAMPTQGTTNGEKTEQYWQEDGYSTMEADGFEGYPKFTMRHDEVLGNNGDARKQQMMIDAGLLPDRYEYMETPDGAPYMIRQYSTANDDTMYQEMTFEMFEELTEQEMSLDVETMAMEMAMADHPAPEDSNHLRGRRRAQLESENEVELFEVGLFSLEVPNDCLEDDNARKCLGVSRSVTGVGSAGTDGLGLSAQETTRIDAIFRGGNGRSAELYAQVVVDPISRQLLSVAGAARGCTTPGQVKLGSLASVGITNCMQGDILWDDGTIEGRLEVSVQCKAKFTKLETTLELAGFLEVLAETDDGVIRFAGVAGGISISAGNDNLAVSVSAEVDAEPTNRQTGDNWVTKIFVTPALEYDLWLFSGSLSYTFRIAQIGPSQLQTTDSLPSPRSAVEFPAPARTTNLPRGDWIEETPDEDDWNRQTEVNSDGSYAKGAISDLVITQRNSNGLKSTDTRGIILAVVTEVDREGVDHYYHVSGYYIEGASTTARIRRISLDDDEWIVRVSGTKRSNLWLTNLILDTNKGRTIHYGMYNYDNNRRDIEFEFIAEDGYALYGFDAYTDDANGVGLYDIRPVWGPQPELACEIESGCLNREDGLPQAIPTNLACTGWPNTQGYSNNEERCLFANSQLNDGYTYVYNYNRFSSTKEPECPGSCWCCRGNEF